MARDMALAGVDRSELTPPPPPQKPKGFSGWAQNFWYHYKPFIIGGIFLAILIAWLIITTARTDPADYELVMVTELAMLPEEIDAMEAYVASCGRDVDGDGKIEVEIDNLTPNYYDELAPTVGHSDGQKLTSYLSTGEKMLFVFDEVSYNGFMDTVSAVTDEDYHFFAPLNTASADYDAEEHYWNWKNDSRRTAYGMGQLPDNMLFGVRTPGGTASNKEATVDYEEGKAMLETLADSVA